MYKSPIEIIEGPLQVQIEEDIYKAVQKVGIHVDKEELLKALEYSKEQYEIGYEDGYSQGYLDGLFVDWIPCSERLPERCVTVLVQDNEKILLGFCDTDNKWYGIYGSMVLGKVKAWQPLPEPYKPQEEEEV